MTFTITHLVAAVFAALVTKELISWLRRDEHKEAPRRKRKPKHMRRS